MRNIDSIFLLVVLIWLVIVGFIGQPINIYFENEEYTVALTQAEAINQLFRTTLSFVLAITTVHLKQAEGQLITA
jgi:hypothetical protein